jgi:hypothetical protein
MHNIILLERFRKYFHWTQSINIRSDEDYDKQSRYEWGAAVCYQYACVGLSIARS